MEREEVERLIDAKLAQHFYEQHKSRGNVFRAPTVDEVVSYAGGRGVAFDGQAWCDHYASNDWKVGKVKMKDWKAGVRNAIRRGWCVLGKLQASKPKVYCACGCGREATTEIDGKKWALYACWWKWQKDLQARRRVDVPKPLDHRLVDRLKKPCVLNGEILKADFDSPEMGGDLPGEPAKGD